MPVSREEGWDPITGLTPPQLCTCPKPGLGISNVICRGPLFVQADYLFLC